MSTAKKKTTSKKRVAKKKVITTSRSTKLERERERAEWALEDARRAQDEKERGRDPKKKPRHLTLVHSVSRRQAHISDSLRRYKTYQLRMLLSRMERAPSEWDPREVAMVHAELKRRES